MPPAEQQLITTEAVQPLQSNRETEKMKFSVKTWSQNGRARVGMLQLTSSRNSRQIEIETPALLLTTRKGLPTFIPPDHLSLLQTPDSRLLQFSPMHFMEVPNSNTISNIGGMHQLLGLNDYGFVAVPRDSILSLPQCNSSNKNGASFETPSGRFLVKPLEYLKMISSMEPDLWVSLPDEVPASVTLKRNKVSVDQTISWLDDCISLKSTDGALFGSIVGGCDVEERIRCAQEVAKRNVSGYYIGGFGLGDSIDERSSLLHAVTDCLPKEKPRQICGLGLPEEVLQGIAAGIDLFDSTYVYHLTLGGFALIFPLDGKFKHVSDAQLTAMTGDHTKINLKATVYRKDASRIVDGCNCFTCQNHTKAYINHLLNVHEMLAQTLLEIHNTHHYLSFFRLIREAITEGKFQELRQKFTESKHNHLLAASPSAFQLRTPARRQGITAKSLPQGGQRIIDGAVQQRQTERETEKMKFVVNAWSKSGRARVGVLHLSTSRFQQGTPPAKDIEIETPALLLTTRKGLPAFIPPDHLSSLPSPDSRLLQFSPMHFMDVPNSKTISDIGGIHQLVGLNDYGFVATPRDSILSLPECNSSNKNGASFETPSGRFLVTPLEYMKMISSMKPDLWVSLADEVPASVTEKRNKASVDRTIRWLDDCISLKSTNGALFGSIVGGSSIEERIRCAQEVAKRNVSGYYIGGFGLGDSIDERSCLLHAVTYCLPSEKPRHVCGLGLPEEVLQGIAAGIDLFDSTYIYHLTLGGFALVFSLDGNFKHVSDPRLSVMAADHTKINLKATVYRKDASRIVDGCKCYTCQNHTKAYINHLLNVHEMLALILLEIHNTHHYLSFFRLIRESITKGDFEELRHKFIDSRRNHLLAASFECF